MDRNIAPESKAITNINLIKAKSTTLDNGIPLHVVNAGSQPAIKLEFLYKAGAWYEDQPAVSYLTTKTIAEGTKKRSSKEITKLFEQYGASLDLNPGLDLVSVSIYCISKFLPQVLGLTREILFEAIFPDEEIDLQKTLKIQQIKVNNEKNSFAAAKLLRKSLFGNGHPYGHDLTANDILAIQKHSISEFYKKRFNDNFEIVVSGKIDEPGIQLINEVFGGIPRDNRHQNFEHEAIDKEGPQLLTKEKSLQSSIRFGRKLFTKNHPDYIDLVIANEILGGYFGSRLMKNIREDKGFTYGISSSIITLQNEGFFAIGTEVKKEHTQATLEEIRKEMKILRTEAIGNEELETVKNFMLGSFLSDINSPFSLADKFKSVYFNHLEYSFYDNYVHRINTIQKEDILEIANKYLHEDSMTEVVVGGK